MLAKIKVLYSIVFDIKLLKGVYYLLLQLEYYYEDLSAVLTGFILAQGTR